MTTATLSRPSRKSEPIEPAAPTWTPSRWALPFSCPAGQQIEAVLTVRDSVIISFRDDHAIADPNVRRQRAGDVQARQDFQAIKDEVAASIDPRSLKAAQQGLTEIPQEIAVAEARLVEAKARHARVQIDPLAGADEKAEAAAAVTAAEKQLSAIKGRQEDIGRTIGQQTSTMHRKVQEAAERIVSQSDAALRRELDTILAEIAEQVGGKLTRLREVHDSLHSPGRGQAAQRITEQLLHDLAQV